MVLYLAPAFHCPRVYGLAVDIGCYEKPGASEPAADSVTLTEDETASGAVTVPYAWLIEMGCDCSTPEKAKADGTADYSFDCD